MTRNLKQETRDFDFQSQIPKRKSNKTLSLKLKIIFFKSPIAHA